MDIKDDKEERTREVADIGCIAPVVISFNKDASCCSGVCVHCKLFLLSISPSAAPSTRPTGSSSMGFWGSLLASDKTLQIKKNTLYGEPFVPLKF